MAAPGVGGVSPAAGPLPGPPLCLVHTDTLYTRTCTHIREASVCGNSPEATSPPPPWEGRAGLLVHGYGSQVRFCPLASAALSQGPLRSRGSQVPCWVWASVTPGRQALGFGSMVMYRDSLGGFCLGSSLLGLATVPARAVGSPGVGRVAPPGPRLHPQRLCRIGWDPFVRQGDVLPPSARALLPTSLPQGRHLGSSGAEDLLLDPAGVSYLTFIHPGLRAPG